MGIESHFFIAHIQGEPVYDYNLPWGDDRCEYRRITPLEAAGILMVLRNDNSDRLELIDEFKLLTSEEAEEWIMSVPHDMVKLLAGATKNDINNWSIRCSEVTSEELSWDSNEFNMVLNGLSKLSQRSIESKKRMFLWNAL